MMLLLFIMIQFLGVAEEVRGKTATRILGFRYNFDLAYGNLRQMEIQLRTTPLRTAG